MDIAPSVAYTCQFGELREVRGVVMLRGDAIVLEYQTQDGLLGVFKSVLITKQIPLAEIDAFEFNRSWFGLFSSITIRTRSMQTLSDIAGGEQNRLELNLDRSERKHAQDLAYHVRLKISERALKQLDSPPVSQLEQPGRQ